MKLLSRLTPAETLLLQEGANAELKNLMKFTFMDLMLKKVIQIKEVRRKAHARDRRTQLYTYMVAGKNFHTYQPKKHELIFINPFYKDKGIHILFKHFVKVAYESANGTWYYQSSVRDSDDLRPYFNPNVFLRLFRILWMRKEGKEVGAQVSDFLSELDYNISDLLENDKEKSLKLLMGLGGNILLLKNVDFDVLRQIDKAIIGEQKEKYRHSFDFDASSWVYIDLVYDDQLFDSYFDSFDDTLDAFDSEFDSSDCSSFDSGCSSCGGCGGCD